jgi:hypothetical protein
LTLAARTHVSIPPKSSLTHASQSTTSTTTPAATDPYLPQPCSTEPSLTGLAPSPMQDIYQRTHSLDVVRFHVFEDAESRPIYSHTLSPLSESDSGHFGMTSSIQVAPLSLSNLPNVQSCVEFEAATTAEYMKAAIELREQALRSRHEMRVARDLVKSARKRRDYAAAQRNKQDAIAHKCEMESLDRRAAKIVFRVTNEVCGHLSPCELRKSCSTSAVPGSSERNS